MHDLIGIAAERLAAQQWAFAGARCESEMRSYLVNRCFRRVGLATVQAMARHRIARVPYIGVPRSILVAQMQRPAPGSQPYAPAPRHFDFYQWQQGGYGGVRA